MSAVPAGHLVWRLVRWPVVVVARFAAPRRPRGGLILLVWLYLLTMSLYVAAETLHELRGHRPEEGRPPRSPE